MNNSFFDTMANDIQNANISDSEKQKLMSNLFELKSKKINIMITGATGCGKSSTINALFNKELAKVGVGADPETMDIQRYDYNNLVLWDSPGLGDGKEADRRHAKNIIAKLNELDENGNPLIDLVLVILDGGSRDLGTSYELINQVIIPNLGEDKSKRILIAINKCDMAMSGRHWNETENRPDEVLTKFLEDKILSVKRRIKEGTGIDVEPIYYSAGFTDPYDDTELQTPPYNLSKLLYYMVMCTPKEKRLTYVDNLNNDETMWKDDDDLKDYREEVRQSFAETVYDSFSDGVDTGSDIGGAIGSIFGSTGEKIGRFAGGLVGGAAGGLIGIFKAVKDRCSHRSGGGFFGGWF